jgi:hypothetical protein
VTFGAVIHKELLCIILSSFKIVAIKTGDNKDTPEGVCFAMKTGVLGKEFN